MADGTVRLAASTCQSLAIKYSANADKRANELEVEAATHLAAAVDQIEHCAVILDEPLVGPDGEITNGRKIQATQQEDEALAKERSSEGDSRHTQRMWEPAWRLIAATLLGLLDVLLLWKPLLNLTFESSSGSIFRWAIGLGLAGLQVLGIEWAARTYVGAERLTADRRGAMGDYNRPLKAGRIGADRPAPDRDELIDADIHLAHAYKALVLIAAFIAVIGGTRVAFLAKRAGLAIYEAGLFGTIVGLILGGLVVQMARLYSRGNLLGDRLQAERDALADLTSKIQHARGMVAGERENALGALAAAEVLTNNAVSIRTQTVADYWRAVQLAWTWFGLSHKDLDYADFERQALPVFTDTDVRRENLHQKLNLVNQWLAERPTVFNDSPALALLPAGQTATQPDPSARYTPLHQPKDGQLAIIGPQPVDVPTKPEPPHLWMLVGAIVTVVATIATAFLATGPETTDAETASPALRDAEAVSHLHS